MQLNPSDKPHHHTIQPDNTIKTGAWKAEEAKI